MDLNPNLQIIEQNGRPKKVEVSLSFEAHEKLKNLNEALNLTPRTNIKPLEQANFGFWVLRDKNQLERR